MKKFFLMMGCSLGILVSNAQNVQSGLWKRTDNAALSTEVFKHNYKPENFITFQLNEAGMQSALKNAPAEKSIVAGISSLIFRVPNSKGEMESYRVVEAPVMEPALAEKYPNIKSYAGQGIEHPQSTIRFDISPLGFHAMIISPDRKTIYINPVDKSTNSYIVFDRENLNKERQTFDCSVDEAVNSQLQASVKIKDGGISNLNANDGKLRQYRLALCTTGEFSTAALNGATGTDAEKKAIVLSVLNTDLTRANAVYERDFGIRMVLVANETNIIYLTASTDPWSSSSVWNSATQTTCDNVIGSANYDVGHLLAWVSSTASNNGNAGCIGCVCKSGSKGSGFTAHTDVQGDPLVIDYWTHELGHQFGGNHTFTFSSEGTIAQVEPGSGSTIMGYAGITGATDLQPHSDDYFSAISIQQITDYTQTGTGSGCAVATLTGNNIPTANAGADFTIPKSTPFILTGSGSDADAADVLSYCWEQLDAYGTSSNSNTYPTSTTTKGPVFRSYLPVTGTSRIFPQLSSILDGTNANKWEVLPSVARTLNFRLTVKDNHTGGGGNQSDNMIVTVNSTSGPFAVTAPNTAITWAAGSQQTVTWNVASSNVTPVNCANVNILLSTDGGQTFSTVLAANTPNDGSELITLPSIQNTTCRIKVESVGNIFFDISNTNFTIGTPPACADPTGLASSAITASGATVSWTAVSGASSYAVDYKLNSSSTWINAATATTAISVNLTGLTASSLYDWRVRTNCSSSNSNYVAAQFTTAAASSCPGTYDLVANESFSAAVLIPLNTDVKGLISTNTDNDYYKFTFVTGGTITVSLTTLPADFDLRLYNSAQTQVAISQNSGTISETINYTVSAGTYYARAYGYKRAKSTTVCYTLKVATGTAAKAGIALAGDAFNKLYPNPAQSVLNISITKLPVNAVIKVFDVNGKQVMRNTLTQKDIQLDVKKLIQGMYFIKIEDASGEVFYTSKFLKQ
ncbi:T9SS type A sorting domain-containing protein [Panacibacter ginsenosidivorans]|uniref:T9SS type A sorting domain-containing protein n=1 Tax=Panacibacter ginsenosidivorans TaxID=1813871 RepID=A0A5B8V6R8_9BACT|nr:zinc-dependent metalloprotease family protein [Panacibacter ginsenosidivorans]QEC67177.1 T9SS type A sorting domain-containing protein [Panacibacter ginsenosidivorans]